MTVYFFAGFFCGVAVACSIISLVMSMTAEDKHDDENGKCGGVE